MRGTAEHGEVVLTAVVGGRGSLRALDFALTRLTPEHFEDPRQRVLIELLRRYAEQTHGIMSAAALADLLRDRAAGSRLDYVAYYETLARCPLPDKHEFLHSVQQLRELAAIRATGDVLSTGLEILRHGVHEDDRDRTLLKGHEDARSYVLAGLAAIETELGMAESPEGDAHDDADDILAAYARAKELQLRDEAPGVLFGIDPLDSYIEGGVGPGEMCLVLGWTTVGKSRMCIQQAWNASVVQGKNVTYFTTETLRPQVCINLVARHSRLPQFGLAEGLNSRKIRAGRLSPSEERALAAVIKDFKTGEYGRLRVIQMPENCTVSGLAARFAAIERQYTPDLCIADYLQLFLPERTRKDGSVREDQSGILKSAERWCAAANKGSGVAFISPWQVNKSGRINMKSSGGYGLEDASETTEAAKTPDIVLSLVDREEDTSGGRRAPLEITALKVRDGARGKRFYVEADYATCHFTERDVAEEVALDLELEAAGV